MTNQLEGTFEREEVEEGSKFGIRFERIGGKEIDLSDIPDNYYDLVISTRCLQNC